MPRETALTKSLREYMAGGQWHSLGEIVWTLGRHIPQEAAAREYKMYSTAWSGQAGQIIAGRKAIMKQALHKLGCDIGGSGPDPRYRLRVA